MALENDEGRFRVTQIVEVGGELIVLLEFSGVEATKAMDVTIFETNKDDVLIVRNESDCGGTRDCLLLVVRLLLVFVVTGNTRSGHNIVYVSFVFLQKNLVDCCVEHYIFKNT